MKLTSAFLLLLLLSSYSQAHYVWLEKDHNKAQLFFGEWHKNKIENKIKLARFNDANFFTSDITDVRNKQLENNFWLADMKSDGDHYMLLDSLPAKESRKGILRKTFYYAKAGRQNITSKLPLELVPTKPEGNQFILFFNGKPLAKTDVVVFGPPKWEKHLRTDKNGKIDFETPWLGQYLMKTGYEAPLTMGKTTTHQPTLNYQYTGTFYNDSGIPWNTASLGL